MAHKKLSVYARKCNYEMGGGVIVVAAYTKKEAFELAIRHPQTRWLFEKDESGNFVSEFYPWSKWYWLTTLYTTLNEPTLIIENHYIE